MKDTMILQPFLESFAGVKARYHNQRSRDPELICRTGHHLGCAVLKLQKAGWTNDDLSHIASQTGIFFSVWVTEKGARDGSANYNIHAMKLRQLDGYRLTSIYFCNRFRDAFDRMKEPWPNVSTSYGCQNLMQGWFKINEKMFARDVLGLMNRFRNELAPIIDGLLQEQIRAVKPREPTV